MLYRTVYFVFYLKRNIMIRKTRYFFLHCVTDIVTVLLSVLATSFITLSEVTFTAWIFMAVKVGIICAAVTLVVNLLFYFKQVKSLVNKVLRRKNLHNRS